jgi:TonB family protein
LDRTARAPERAPNPTNPLPYARGNTAERVEAPPELRTREQGPLPDPSVGESPDRSAQQSESESASLPAAESAVLRSLPGDANPAAAARGGSLGEALRNLQRFVQQDNFDNPQGGGGAFGPSIQFDTKGVEFGPWIRRFVAQIKRNWFIPYAAMAMKGHVVITFFVHKDGSISALNVAGPSSVESFNNAAYNALAASNPTQPLPPEYPSDRAFFTVTFYYNETPSSP